MRTAAPQQAVWNHRTDRNRCIALQVATCTLQKIPKGSKKQTGSDTSFCTSRFAKELRILVLELAAIRALMSQGLPFMKVVTMDTKTAVSTLPNPPQYMVANLASTEGSIRLGQWLSDILGDDKKGGKTALRKFIYCSSTSCGSNKSAQFPLQIRVRFVSVGTFTPSVWRTSSRDVLTHDSAIVVLWHWHDLQ